MKSRMLWLSAALAVVASVSLTAACSSTGSIPPAGWWVSYGGASYCVESNSVKLTLPLGKRGELEFKDMNGAPVGPKSHIDGGGTVEVPVPVGGVAYDWDVGGVDETGTSYGPDQAAAPPLVGSATFASAASFGHDMPSTFIKGCQTAKFDPAKTSYSYLLHAVSYDAAEAFAQMNAVLQGKVGTPVAPSVFVDAFTELSIEGDYVKVVSSLTDPFTSFTATINGHVVADLGVGFNAALSYGPNGWVSVTSYMPLALLHGGETLYLHQQAMGAPEPAYMAIQG